MQTWITLDFELKIPPKEALYQLDFTFLLWYEKVGWKKNLCAIHSPDPYLPTHMYSKVDKLACKRNYFQGLRFVKVVSLFLC